MTGQITDCPSKSFQTDAAIAQHLRVVLSSGKASVAAADDNDIGTLAEESFAANDWRTVTLNNKMGTRKYVASAAITQYAECYGSAGGKISSTPSGRFLGTALEAASGDGSQIEVLPPSSGGGGGGGGAVVVEEVTFTEDGDTTYTGSVTVPAGAYILDVIVHADSLWDDGTSALLIVGDATDPNGFYDAVDLKATDLLAGESISFGLTGGKEGADLDGGETAGDACRRRYLAASRVVTGVVTTGGQNGSAGVTRMIVVYTTATSTVAATGA